MKTTSKTLLSICALFFTMALPSNAQLKVLSNGYIKTNMATGTALSPLSIGGAGNSSYFVSVNSTDKKGLFVQGNGNGVTIQGGYGDGPSNAGLYVFPNTNNNSYYDKYGIHASSAMTNQGVSVGVGGFCINSGSSVYGGSGIYGSSTTSTSFAYPGIYAGYFYGNVRVTGSIYGILLSPSASNGSGNYGEGTTVSVVDTDNRNNSETSDESISEKLRHVQLLQLTHRRDMKANTQSNNTNITFPEKEGDTELSPEEFAKYLEENKDAPAVQTEMASTRYELAVDQLRDVFPELVYEDKYGNISINYMEMIPLLVQALKEQQTRIDILEGKTVKHRAEAASITTADDVTLYLGQNNPNPFSEQTSIEVRIPNEVKTAFLCIYDMNGKQIDKIVIDERGTTRVSILGTSLTEGMYLYSLIADGKVAGTKKMILTK